LNLRPRQQFKFSYFEQVKLNKKIGVKKMSKKRTKYTSAFKTKLVLELLQNKKHEIMQCKHFKLRFKSWKPECVLSFNMDWQIKFTNIRQLMLKLM
jgi:hypothetical protein